MSNTAIVDRDRWLGYRWSGHGLGGHAEDDVLDDLLLLGLQGSRQSNGEQALSQRTTSLDNTAIADAITPSGPAVCMWSVRGAPHAHSADQLDLVRDALAPLESDDGGAAFVEAVDEVAAALGRIVQGKTPKGDASRQVADEVSPSLSSYCPRCDAVHVPDGMFRAAVRQAQVVIGPSEGRATIFYPRPKVKQQSVENPHKRFLETFFRVNGPITKTLYRDWQEAGTTGITRVWNDLDGDLVKVKIGSKRCDLPESLLDRLRTASPPKGAALVPPNDPYLRQADRALLVPDSTRRQKVFKALSGPGALLVNGEVAGMWRYRSSSAEVTIEPFDRLTPTERKAAEEHATAIATSTGGDEPTIIWA
ncbi:DNA glycosylase AlkZ-like family protein [Solicola gregarius]|uniref:Winged helix DNA-binding domain-containing protein n=1 Tax=Solicola gregarius TaxID=2908642 RepID=A0AA46TE35_9ACTN|nr:crosslink repair DNA glycosylase YcaQ family protein [Solicola gregarius]UYM03654.1 winged helix DNA-binding domain-containing protein [Solicola gregarius]